MDELLTREKELLKLNAELDSKHARFKLPQVSLEISVIEKHYTLMK